MVLLGMMLPVERPLVDPWQLQHTITKWKGMPLMPHRGLPLSQNTAADARCSLHCVSFGVGGSCGMDVTGDSAETREPSRRNVSAVVYCVEAYSHSCTQHPAWFQHPLHLRSHLPRCSPHLPPQQQRRTSQNLHVGVILQWRIPARSSLLQFLLRKGHRHCGQRLSKHPLFRGGLRSV